MVFCCVVPEVIADTSLPSDMPVKRRGEEGKVLLEVNRNFPLGLFAAPNQTIPGGFAFPITRCNTLSWAQEVPPSN